MDTPIVSVLMTSYNREKYIGAAIESVLASTYKNFELIIVDDLSKDRTVEIAESYGKNDNRIKIFINEKNLGDYPNRNKAAGYATGKYLKYIDADDCIYPWGLQLLVEMMEQFPEAGWGLCSLAQDKEKIFPFVLDPEQIYFYNYFSQIIFNKAPLSSIILTSVFKEIGGFSGKQYLGDFEFWHLLALKYPLVLMPHGMVWYREHSEQQMSDHRRDAEVPFRYTMSKLNFFKNCKQIPLSDEQKNGIIKKINKGINKLIFIKLVKFQWRLAFKLMQMRKDKSLKLGNY